MWLFLLLIVTGPRSEEKHSFSLCVRRSTLLSRKEEGLRDRSLVHSWILNLHLLPTCSNPSNNKPTPLSEAVIPLFHSLFPFRQWRTIIYSTTSLLVVAVEFWAFFLTSLFLQTHIITPLPPPPDPPHPPLLVLQLSYLWTGFDREKITWKGEGGTTGATERAR